MTEAEYIQVSNLMRLRLVEYLLRDVIRAGGAARQLEEPGEHDRLMGTLQGVRELVDKWESVELEK